MGNKLQDNLEILSDKKAILGECPVWDSEKELLYWVDVIGKKIFTINIENSIQQAIDLDIFPGCIVLTKNREFIIASENGIFIFSNDNLILKKLCDPEKDLISNRFNDGKCDALGRFWVGTTSNYEEDKVGSLYCFEKSMRYRKVLGGIIVSNGIAWSNDNKTIYYNDSPTRIVRAYDYDIKDGSISNERTVITFSDKEGFPDGMTIDIEDKLWIAHWGGYKVGRWDPISGKMIDKIDIPVKRVSSLTFGGYELDELFITTAIRGFSEKEEDIISSSGDYDGMVFRTKTYTKGIDNYRYTM
jgi:sugar lactone lactonase YvrE